MLPTHRPPPSIEHLAKLSRPGYRPLCSRFTIRWALLACGVLALLWFALPAVGIPGWHPGDLSEFGLGHPPPGPPPPGPPPPTFEEQMSWEPKKNMVRKTFQRAWNGYMARAFPADELHSVSGNKMNSFNGWAVTVFDSLSTMWIMGLREEFHEAIISVKDMHLKLEQPQNVPFFETIIRYLGGSLSAHALSGNKDILNFAEKLGEALLPAFNTTSGLPSYSVNVKTGDHSEEGAALFAEVASCQLEYKYLAKLTGRKEYYHASQKVMDVLYKADPPNGLYSLNYWRSSGEPASSLITAGSMTDSAYEYFLKQWIMFGDERAKQQYIKSANGIINNLVYVTPNRGLMYAGDIDSNNFNPRYQHLTCYLPGLLMLGATVLQQDLSPAEREYHQWVAEGLTYTCYIGYRDQKTNLGPEISYMEKGTRWVDLVEKWKSAGRNGKPPGLREPPAEKDKAKRDYLNSDSKYMLRPETVESVYYMWKLTGDVKWRERGLEIYEAIEAQTRTEFGYASVSDVDSGDRHMDEMPSFFLAETLKYLYLLFDDVNTVDFSRWVFNTEAHPLPVITWTSEEKAAFGI